ncbi:GGDEF domain-containing protein [Bacillus sp. BHET2]|uniref:diguanylate cyclase n=1 Tax=Bacillus sp. BHET2 TaxID=2583818 RepID=UPI00110F2E1C|nr:diguanylate cyclase [Bacillus sp. BHET2]TMU87222.1 GGDEF domain-containing protein [Bacillus sp. BHET2]
MKKYILLFCITFAFFGMCAPILHTYATESNESIVIPESLQEMDLSNRLEVLIDQDHLTENEIIEHSREFVPLAKTNPSGDISDTVYWLKVNLANASVEQKDLLLEIKKPHLSSVTLYTLETDRLKKGDTIGYRYPFGIRDYKHRNLVFTLHLLPEASTTYFLKIETDSFFQAPVSLWDPIAFSEANNQNQLILGVFYGIMIALIIYNSFLFFSLKEKSYLYYILFVSGFTMLQAIWDGFAFQFVWGDFPWWALRSNSFFILWSCLFALLFARHFLQLKENAPIVDKVVTIFNTVCGLCLVLPFFVKIGTMTMISTVMATIFVVFLMAIAFRVRLKTREATFYIIAWSLLFIGVLLNLFAAYKLLPLTHLTLFAPKFGVVVEVLVLSLGLADKINRMRKEKEDETKKYYAHTFLQNALKEMSATCSLDSLSKEGLRCLMDVTHFEKGFYLSKNGTIWRVISKVNVPAVLEKYYIEQFISFQNGDAFGVDTLEGSTFTVPISCGSHNGRFVIWSKQEEIDLSFMDSFLPAFIEQFTAFAVQKGELEKLQMSAMQDHLTNMFNRKYFLEKANEVYVESEPVSLLLIDIDHFKNINDTYGHIIGDQAITFAAALIKKVFDDVGIVGRFGGEEFIVFMENTNQQQALGWSNLILDVFRQEAMQLENGTAIYLTISIGFSSSKPLSFITIDDMIQMADEQLYKAKKNGRNQVVSVCS